MAFLPVQAANRSQRVRIGGKTILPRITSYIDLGQIAPVSAPTFTFTKEGKESEGRGLKKSVWFAYGVSAVDASGNETPIAIAAAKTEAGAETAEAKNFVILAFVPVAHAVKYNLFRTGVGKTGFASEALALAATPKLIATVAASTVTGLTGSYTDANGLSGSEEGTTTNSGVNTTFYNTSGTAWSTFHELQNHLAIGALIVVGNLTPNPNDYVPVGKAWEVTLEAEKVKVAELKELLQRSTGEVRKVATASPTAKKVEAEKERYTLLVYNSLTNVVESIEGAEETEKAGVLATTTAKLTKYQQVLLVLRTTHASTTPTIFSGLENLTRVVV